MKIHLSVDIEGVAGVFHPEQIRPGNPEYERARRWMTDEANAVIEGALQAGVREIVVADGHAHYRNLLADVLHPAARLVQGKPRPLGMLAGLDAQVDGLVMLGYHARAQSRGILAHTMNGAAFARVWLDGVEAGEAAIYGGLAREYGVPVILASGDDVFAEEAATLAPAPRVVVVKTAESAFSGSSLAPREACTRLRDAAAEAVRLLGQGRFALTPAAPGTIACRLQANSVVLADLFAQLPILEREDSLTLGFPAPSFAYLVRILNCLSAMSAALR